MRFRGVRFIVAVALLLTPLAAAVPAGADAGPSGADVVQQCQANVQGALPIGGAQTCRTAQAGEWGAAAACRTPLYAAPDATAPEDCAPIDGRPVSEARIDAYQTSWTHRALALQRTLDAHAPLVDEEIPHTHNSFNSSAYTPGSTSYYPTLTNQDPNQAYSITDQLKMDVRAIEMDLHWVPSPYGTPDTGGYAVTDCHGDSQTSKGVPVHVGCTWDRPFSDTLDELAAWLHDPANAHEFVLLYLENQLDGSAQGHTIAGDLIAQKLRSLVYKPPADQPCAPMPTTVSVADILATGAQVLIVGNCDTGNGQATSWGSEVHARGPHWDESGDPTNYNPTQCASDNAKHAAGAFIRYYEEVTWLGATGDTYPAVTSPVGHVEPITLDAVSQMVNCGVNIIGLDQLTPQDPRLAALVWSWAPNQPSVGGCAYERSNSRFYASACGVDRAYACVDSTGAWQVTSVAGPWSNGSAECAAEFPGSRFSVPVNGLHNQELAAAWSGVSTANSVWLNYSGTGDAWTPDALAPVMTLPQSGIATTGPAAGPAAAPAAAQASPAGASRSDAAAPVLAARLASSSRGRDAFTFGLAVLVVVALLLGVAPPAAARRKRRTLR